MLTNKGPLHIDIVLHMKQISQLLKYERLNIELKSILMISLLAEYYPISSQFF
jgi:hypothetical protein